MWNSLRQLSSGAIALSPELQALENEAIHVLREVAAQSERPALLFSGGKDSIVLAELARRAFFPAPPPFPLLHVDTGHNFPETLEYRDEFVSRHQLRLLVALVQDSIDQGRVAEESGPRPSRNGAQTVTLLDAIRQHNFDCCLGGARRDEEKARAKERFFSHRDRFGQWDPKNQRPELWNLYNGRKQSGEHFRVFPLSNWTELDVWHYIQARQIPMPSLYFSHRRAVVRSAGALLAHSPHVPALEGESIEELTVRFRTIGDMTCTGATESRASNLAEIVAEVAAARLTERGGRTDDRRSEAAMEDRKRQGYF